MENNKGLVIGRILDAPLGLAWDESFDKLAGIFK
jgi:hypothetical protein